MASIARYPNLPSVDLVTIDDGLVAVTGRPVTQSVLIIGPALDGPVNTVVPLNAISDPSAIFGSMTFTSTYVGPQGQTTGYSGNGLLKAIREVSAGGCADIRALRVGGTAATGVLTIAGTGVVAGTLNAKSVNGGRLYNQVSVVFTSGSVSGTVTINQPAVKGPSLVLNFMNAASGTTINSLINLINGLPRNQAVRFTLGTMDGTQPMRLLGGTITLAGGTDGTIMDDLSTGKESYYSLLTAGDSSILTGVSSPIVDYEADIIYLADVYADDVVVASTYTKSVAQDLADYLGRRTVDSPMLGVLGIRPLADYSTRANIQNHYLSLVDTLSGVRADGTKLMKFGYFLNNGFTLVDGSLDQPIDTGGYLQVVAGDVMIQDGSIGLYQESAAGLYAGFLSALPPQEPATYKTVPGIFGLPYEFTRAQLDTMNGGIGADASQGILGGGAYVTVRRVAGHGTLFVRDVTASQRRSDFKDLQPLRIVNAVHLGVKGIAFPYLGKQNNIQNRSAMESQVKAFLDLMGGAGVLLGKEGIGYFVQISASNPINRQLGIIEIDITLRPALQIKTIRVKVRLSL